MLNVKIPEVNARGSQSLEHNDVTQACGRACYYGQQRLCHNLLVRAISRGREKEEGGRGRGGVANMDLCGIMLQKKIWETDAP